MKNKTPRRRQAPRAQKGRPLRPARSQHAVFRQVCNLIPGHRIPVLARRHNVDAREFSETSHVQSLLYGHAAHALSLNDICDALAVHEAEFMRVRGATPPARNTFSNAKVSRAAWESCAPLCGSRLTSANSSTRSSPTTQPSRKIPCNTGGSRGTMLPVARLWDARVCQTTNTTPMPRGTRRGSETRGSEVVR